MFKNILGSLVSYEFYKHIKDKFILIWEKKRVLERVRMRKRGHFRLKKILNISKHLDLRYYQKHSKIPWSGILRCSKNASENVSRNSQTSAMNTS